jgi:hypothetical protein
MKDKLSRITNPWHRLMITVLVNSLLWLGTLLPSSRARVHWIGGPRRPRRIERPIVAAMFISAMALLEPHQYAYWCALIGGGVSIFVVLCTVYLLIPKQQYHWIGK